MDERRRNYSDPWQHGIYETGRTKPPKSHGGLIAVLLVIVIFLVGLVSALSVLNVKLFQQLNNLPTGEDEVAFHVNTTDETQEIASVETW